MPLTLASPVVDVDRGLATRRTGSKTKGPEAWIVLREAFGIEAVGQLLHHYPRRYIDRSRVESIRDLVRDQQATVIATVRSVDKRQAKRRKTNFPIVTVTLADATGQLDLTFFNQPWLATTYKVGMELAVSGLPHPYAGRLQLANQEVEILKGEDDLVHVGRITPVHPAAEGISTKTLRELVHRALEHIPTLTDPLPVEVVVAEKLTDHDAAIRHIHFPADDAELAMSRERLKFDELFMLELGVAYRKQRLAVERKGVTHDAHAALPRRFVAALPFEPTDAQRRAMADVTAAMASSSPMNVLLQGDVGSGKTLVALHACLTAIGSGHQAAIMAPTEVLAGQHGRTAGTLLTGVGARPFGASTPPDRQGSLFHEPAPSGGAAPLTYAVLTGAVAGNQRAAIVEAIAAGSVDLVIGTHALVQEAITFHDLTLAVIDEQHRFGLHQRMALKGKGGSDIDVVIMTATPIPRTLALTYYGDLDVTTLDEMPSGRLPITTWAARSAAERHRAEALVRSEAEAGRRAFVVCAAIDEDNRKEVKSAEAEAERLRADVFPDLRVELLHGRMRPKEKERVMDAFRAGDADVLISTTVIEVGVDVPEATVMLVENAERFGLAQLHQLRGRIGRGPHASTCVLFDESGPGNFEARARIDAMVRTTDGFELADEDLRLRGEGTLFDARQSGMPDLRLARLADDLELVRRARARAFALLDADPGLGHHRDLLDELRRRFAGSIEWLFRS